MNENDNYNNENDIATQGEDNAVNGANGADDINTQPDDYNADNKAEAATDEADDLPAPKPAKKKLADGASGTYVHTFKKPFEYEGKKYKTLTFYFERLTGRDVLAIEHEMQENGEFALDPILSRTFQCKMAAKAGRIGSDALEAMSLRDFNKIAGAAKSFLMADSDN